MPLEQATYINQLQPEWPLGSDPEKQGDDHFRMMKKVLQNTFPHIDGAVTGAPAALNNLTDGVTYAAQQAPTPATFTFWQPDRYRADGTRTTAAIAFAPSNATQAAANANLGVNWAMVQNLIYPIHSVLISSNNANPATYLGFGTWASRAGYLAGIGSMTDNVGCTSEIKLGPFGGNWRVQNSMIVAQALSLASGVTNSAGDHWHEMPANPSDQEGMVSIQGSSSQSQGNLSAKMSSAGNHDHTVSGTITIGSGSATSGAVFSPPRYAFYVWERTA